MEVIETANKISPVVYGLAESLLVPWFQNREGNFANVVMAAMMVAEKYGNINGNVIAGADKEGLAQQLIPVVVDILVINGKITPAAGLELKNKLSLSIELVKGLMDAYIVLSKNPAFIQLQDEAVAALNKTDTGATVVNNATKVSKSNCWSFCFGR